MRIGWRTRLSTRPPPGRRASPTNAVARASRWALAAILAAAVLSLAKGPSGMKVTGDSFEYMRMARYLASARTYAFEPLAPTAARAPLYPTFLALAAGRRPEGSLERVRAAQALLLLTLAACVYGLGAALHSPQAGLAAALLTAFHPDLRQAAGLAGVETLFALCVLGAAASLALWVQAPGPRSAALFGASIGASLWCRSTLALLPPLAFALSMTSPRQRAARGGWLVILLPYLALAPWAARNHARFGTWIPYETQGRQENLFTASLGKLGALGTLESHALGRSLIDGWEGMDYLQRERALRLAAYRNILAGPSRYALGSARRLLSLWRPHWALLMAAAAALALLRRRAWVAAVGLLPLYWCVHALMGTNARFTWPVLPVLALLAGAAAAEALRAAVPRTRPRSCEPLKPWVLMAAVPALALAAVSAAGLGAEALTSRPAMEAVPAALCPAAGSRPWPWTRPRLTDPKRAHDHGVILYLQGRKAEALSCFQGTLALEPRYAAAHLSASTAHAALGHRPEALLHAREAVALLERLEEDGPLLAAARSTLDSALRGVETR